MKKVFLALTGILGAWTTIAQNNPNANPYVLGINAAASPIEVSQTTTTTFDLGNHGSDPIPAGGARWNISFPPNVTVNQASLNMDGGTGMFAATWNVVPGNGTYLQLDAIGAGVPAFTLSGPQAEFHMTVQITGLTAGTALQQSINAEPLPAVAQNVNAGDDNAFGPIQVVPAGTLPVNLVAFNGRMVEKEVARLNWEISNPDKFSHFELERSTPGTAFKKVASIALTSDRKYQHDDDVRGIDGQKVLYRLRMVDIDGTSALSDVVLLKIAGTAQDITVFPNPATSTINVTGITVTAKYTLVSLDGRALQKGNLDAAKPEIGISALPVGAFLLHIESDGQTKAIKMIKK